MTEEDWSKCSDPSPMLESLRGRASERKLQLFGVACCRRVWHLMTNPVLRHSVEAAECYADGKISKTGFEEICVPVCELWGALPDATATEWEPNHYMIGATRHLGSGDSAPYAASYAARGLACRSQQWGSTDWSAALNAESAAQCDLIRDLFGDPTIPFHFDRDWLTGDGIVAVAYAREIYQQEYPDSLALLADLMERAGCRDRAALEHCRGPGPHYRGCWVVDALLEHEPAVRSGLETETDWQTSVHSATLLHFLRDKGDIRKWRLFAVACCRRMNHLITDPHSQWSVEVATRYADGKVSDEEVEAARSAAQKAQEEAQRAEWSAEADANFCETPTYAAASCHLYATAAARSAICRDPRRTDHEPGSYEASGWHTTHEYLFWAAGDETTANLGKVLGKARWDHVRVAAKSARFAEQQAQCDLLRDIFGEYFGPPGSEGGWLPFSDGHEYWCLLPTRKIITLHPEWLTWSDGLVKRLAQAIYDEEAFERLPVLADALEEAGCTECNILDHLRQPGPHVRGCWIVDLLLARG